MLAMNHTALAIIKPVVPDMREFLRGTIPMMEGLLPYKDFGITLPHRYEVLRDFVQITASAVHNQV